jgi:hypothetical protein
MAAMAPPGQPEQDQGFLQALTTEHFTLQTAQPPRATRPDW